MAKFALISKPTPCGTNPDLSCPIDFDGFEDPAYNVTEEVNWSWGPESDFLMGLGAKWSGCMRYSSDAKTEANLIRVGSGNNSNFEGQCLSSAASGVGYLCDATLTGTTGVACCETFKAQYGMRSYEECRQSLIRSVANESFAPDSRGLTRDEYAQFHIDAFPFKVDKATYEVSDLLRWKEGDLCGSTKPPILRPCCGIRMKTENFCELLTESQCIGRSGTYQSDQILCSDVMCFSQICKILDVLTDKIDTAELGADGLTKSEKLFGIKTDTAARNQPVEDSGNFQWWRFIMPLFLHSGLISCLLIMVVQVYTGRNIEVQAGFMRTFLIYFISGIGGNAISASFSPKTVSMGADPAAYGFLGVEVVELFQAWQVIPNPKTQLAKLFVIISVLMLLGTLPYIDNWSHVGGFAFGIVSGVVFLPYITFGKWDARRKKLLLFGCIPLLIFMFGLAFFVFYKIPNTDWCPKADLPDGRQVNTCGYFNCIQWHSSINCDEYY